MGYYRREDRHRHITDERLPLKVKRFTDAGCLRSRQVEAKVIEGEGGERGKHHKLRTRDSSRAGSGEKRRRSPRRSLKTPSAPAEPRLEVTFSRRTDARKHHKTSCPGRTSLRCSTTASRKRIRTQNSPLASYVVVVCCHSSSVFARNTPQVGCTRTSVVASERFVRQVEEGKEPRLLLMMPPRSGKSEISSRHTPAWILGQHPEWESSPRAHAVH